MAFLYCYKPIFSSSSYAIQQQNFKIELQIDDNGKSSDYESVYESRDAEYHSDSSVSHGFTSDGFLTSDFDNLSHCIATNPVTQVPDQGKLTQPPWS